MKIFFRALIIIMFAGSALFSLKGVFASNTPAEGYKVPKGQTIQVTGPVSGTQTCKKVTNNCSNDIFVPTKSAAEWTGNFIPNKPTCVSLAECVNCDRDGNTYKNNLDSCNECDFYDDDADLKQTRVVSQTAYSLVWAAADMTSSTNYIASGCGFFGCVFASFSCQNNLQWLKVLANSVEYSADGYQVDDLNVITGATGQSIIAGIYDEGGTYDGRPAEAMLAKINHANGSLVWAKRLTPSNPPSGGTIVKAQFYRVSQTSDNGFVAVGKVTGYMVNNINDALIAKFNSTGGLQWARIWRPNLGGDSYGAYFSAVEQVSDGGFIAVGADSSSTTGLAATIVKYSSTGVKQWGKYIPKTEAYEMIKAADGNLVLTGVNSNHLNGGNVDGWVMKFSPTGVRIWSTVIGDDSGAGYYSDYFEDVIQTSDGGYIAVGGSATTNGIMAKLNSSGRVQWIKYLECTSGSCDYIGLSGLWDVEQFSSNGDYLLIGSSGDDSILSAGGISLRMDDNPVNTNTSVFDYVYPADTILNANTDKVNRALTCSVSNIPNIALRSSLPDSYNMFRLWPVYCGNRNPGCSINEPFALPSNLSCDDLGDGEYSCLMP